MIVKHYLLGGVAEDIGQLQTQLPEDHPLAGVGVKLERARKHLKTLNLEMSEYLDRYPYSFELERGQFNSEYVLRAYTSEPPPLAWSALIGDFLQNLRVALEYLVWELARANVGSEPRRKTSFPIYLKRKEFFSDGKLKIQDLASEPQSIIEEMQPYNRSYVSRSGVVNVHAIKDFNRWYRGHILWTINELARRDRHQALRVVGAGMWVASGSSAIKPQYVKDSSLEFGRFAVGSVMARWVISEEAAAYAKLEERTILKPSVSLLLNEKNLPTGHSAIMVLVGFLEYVDGEIVPALKRFFA